MMNKTISTFLFGLLLSLLPVWMMAAPANPRPFNVVQPDGTTITVRLVGDEFAYYMTTADGFPIAKAADGFYRYAEISASGELVPGAVVARNAELRTDAERAMLAALPAKDKAESAFLARRSVAKSIALKGASTKAAQPSGNMRGLVVLVQFQDVKFKHSHAEFDNMMNQDGYNYNGAYGSVQEYFVAQSNRKYTPKFDVVGPITLSQNVSYYGADQGSSIDAYLNSRLPAEVCDAVNSQVDFTQYDADGDGEIDLVYFIYAGAAQSDTGESHLIWPKRAWATPSGNTKRWDGKSLGWYACSAEGTGEYHNGIGVLVHEYTHSFGLPDWYDINGDTDGKCVGPGSWSILHSGCYNDNGRRPVGFSAYERSYCGWLTPEELPSTGVSLSLDYIGDRAKAYRMSSNDANQYFLLENRQQKGWDEFLPASGLMITKIHYNAYNWSMNLANSNASTPGYSIVAADCSTDNPEGDLFPYAGHNSFTKNSSPSSTTNTAGTIDCPITNITHHNGVISFDVRGGGNLGTPVIESLSDDGDGFTATWSSVGGAYYYNLRATRKPIAGGTSEIWKEVTVLGETSWRFFQMPKGFIYTVQVQAKSASGEVGAWSAGRDVTLEPDEVPYTITLKSSVNGSYEVKQNGKAIADGASIMAGTVLTIDAMPDAGYELDYITVNGSLITGTSFVVSADSRVAVYFREKTLPPGTVVCLITYAQPEHGSFVVKQDGKTIANGAKVISGTVLTVEATPDEGYELDGITVNGTAISGTSFTVSEATTVAVTFREELPPPPFAFADFAQPSFGVIGNCGKVLSVVAGDYAFGPYGTDNIERDDPTYMAQMGYLSPDHDITARAGDKVELSVKINAAWGKFAIFTGSDNDHMERILLCGHQLGWTAGGTVDEQFNNKILFLEDNWENGAQTAGTLPYLQIPENAQTGTEYLIRMMFFTPQDADLGNRDAWTFDATYREGHHLDFKVTVVGPPVSIQNAISDEPAISIANGIISCNQAYTLYSIDGRRLPKDVRLPSGVYIVKTKNGSKKVAVD